MPYFLLRSCAICFRWAGWGLLSGIIFTSLLLLTLRYWLLPDIGKFRYDIAAAVTRMAGQPVHIDNIHANWDGLRPHLSLQGVRVSDPDGNPVLVLPKIEGTVSWRSVLRGELNFHEIMIDRPALVTRRDTEGHLHIAGVVLNGAQQQGGFFDWLLRQRRLIINQALIYWQDDLRKNPVLYFESVNLRLQNGRGGRRHRFGLQARPSEALASRVDIRGEFTGDSVQALSAWEGRLFIQLQGIDLGTWQKWAVLPGEQIFERGKGGIRAWADIHMGNPTRWIADVHLHDTAIRFAQHLPWLEMDKLQGRWGWSKTEEADNTNETWFARHFRVGLKDSFLTPPATLSWRVENRRDSELLQHNLQADELDIDILMRLTAYLPVEDSLREFLSDLSPGGTVKHVNLEWRGSWSEDPPFKVNAGFSDLAVRSFGGYPSFTGVSGIIDATETGGSIFLASKNLEIGKARQPESKLLFDTLTGRMDWKISPDHEVALLKFNDIVFSGNGVNGTVQGHYTFGKDMPGQINLTGKLPQADVVHLGRQIAWIAGEAVADPINETVSAGRLNDAKFHIKGILNGQFTAGEKEGLSIQAQTGIRDAVIRLSDNWPALSVTAGRVSLQDGSLHIALPAANFSSIRLQNLILQAGNLYAENPVIRIKGAAEGESEEIVALIQKVPLNLHAGELLSQTEVSGKGRLQADVTMSAGQEAFSITGMQGRYQFIDNRIDFGRYVPDLYRVNGALVFTDSSVTLDHFHAQTLGGPVEIFSTPLPEGGVRITASGRANFDLLQTDASIEPVNLSQLWTRSMRGSTNWQARMNIEQNKIGIVVESLLEGAESALPAPFSKTAAEIVPVRFEKYFTRPRDDRVRFRYGDIVTAEFQRIREKAHHYHPVRGVISFGGNGALPQDQVTRIKGRVSRLEWDQWRELFRQHGAIASPDLHSGRGLDNLLTESAQFDLQIGEFEFLGSYFNDSTLAINKQGKVWQMEVSSQEVTGKIDWYETDPQRVVARLSRLVMPEAVPESVSPSPRDDLPRNWPAVDIEADELIIKGVLLGQLKLDARQKQEGWQVENLDIEHPDSRLQANGIWQNHKPPFRVYSNIHLQSGNIGKFLKRHGYPGRVARGEGVVEGNLGWTGKPFSVDFPSLSGTLDITARRGQFTGLKPGIGRLLGIFDLKSLPRRLMLDFYDVFGKGFGFDYFHGNINIRNGIASADDLHITGSAAELFLKGEWDLVKETQSLNLKVFPSFGLATPIAGIAAMIATQTLQDPFDRVLLNEYTITGSWSEPIVVKLNNKNSGRDHPQIQPQLEANPQ